MTAKRIYSILLICGICHGALTQSKQEILVDSLNDLSYDLGGSSASEAINLAKKAKSKAEKIGYFDGVVTAFLRIGSAYELHGNYRKALTTYTKAEKYFSEHGGDSIVLAKVFIYQGIVLNITGETQESLKKNEMAFHIANRHGNKPIMSSTLLNSSNIYKDRGEYQKALQVLHEAKDGFNAEDFQEKGNVQLNIGNAYDLQGRYQSAIESYKKANLNYKRSKNQYSLTQSLINIGSTFLSLMEVDSALVYYQLAENKARDKFTSLEALIINNRGSLYYRIGDLDSALVYFQKSLNLYQDIGDVDNQMMTLQNIGDVAMDRQSYNEAKELYLESYQIADEKGDLQQLKTLSSKLSNTFSSLENFEKANEYSNLSLQYQDSIADNMSKSLIYEMSYKDQEHEISNLKLEVKNKNLKLQKQFNFILLLSTIVFISIILIFVIYRNHKNKRKRLKAEKESIENLQRIKELINEQEKAQLNAMFDGQESERNRISKELHDNLGSMLSTVKLYFKAMDNQINHLKDENVKKYEKATELLDEACDETRKIAHQLSSERLKDLGLFATIKTLSNQINDSDQFIVNLNTHGDDTRLNRIIQNSIYRIIQELVNNVTKHAQATEIGIQLNVFDELFNLIIEDNGIGFDVNNLINKNGLGLREIEVRVKSMNGEFTIDSGRGVGTTITIDIPLNEKNDKSTVSG